MLNTLPSENLHDNGQPLVSSKLSHLSDSKKMERSKPHDNNSMRNEFALFKNVLAHTQFRQNPLQALRAHINASISKKNEK